MFRTGNNNEVRRASPAASTNGSLSIKRRKQCDVLRNADSEFSELCKPIGDNFQVSKLQIVNSTYVYTSLVDTKNHLYGTVNVYAVSSQSSPHALKTPLLQSNPTPIQLTLHLVKRFMSDCCELLT